MPCQPSEMAIPRAPGSNHTSARACRRNCGRVSCSAHHEPARHLPERRLWPSQLARSARAGSSSDCRGRSRRGCASGLALYGRVGLSDGRLPAHASTRAGATPGRGRAPSRHGAQRGPNRPRCHAKRGGIVWMDAPRGRQLRIGGGARDERYGDMSECCERAEHTLSRNKCWG